MSKPVTIKDLARQLKISVSTVSRALRNANDINHDTREAVLKLARELEYEPNFIAQSLVMKQTRIIGVVVPLINSNYFSEALSGMTDLAIEQNYHLMICQSNERVDQENKSIRKLLGENEWVKSHLEWIVIGIVVVATAPVAIKMITKKFRPGV